MLVDEPIKLFKQHYVNSLQLLSYIISLVCGI